MKIETLIGLMEKEDVIVYDIGGACKLSQEDKQMIVDALKKQIPMKPKKEPYPHPNENHYATKCPNGCTSFGGEICVSEWQNYCHHCGQALDWSDEE